MAATTTYPKPTCINRQPRWLLASLVIVTALATVLAGCGAPTTQPAGPVSRPLTQPAGPPLVFFPDIPASHCIDTADHGCISTAEFETLRDDIAREYLAIPEYQEQKALEVINAHQAHAALEVVHGSGTKPGAGVTIGVIDSGVDLSPSELAATNVEEFLLQGVPDETMNDPRGSSHGTAVTSIIAAQPNDRWFIGLAWGAHFKVFAAPIGGPYPGGYDPVTFDWVEAYKTVLASGVDIVNASYSIPGTFVENYTAELIRIVQPELAVAAQKGVSEPTIFVWGAGNDHGDPCSRLEDENCIEDPGNPLSVQGHYDATSPNLEGGAIALLAELQGHGVVVVALDRDGTIADFSNRCGIAANWCIAAPGSGIIGAYFGPRGTGVARGLRGTSYATPLVSGGLALMKQLFRNQLSNRELVTRLFLTADKSGDYADAASYGQGALDLGTAVSPVGTPRVTTGNQVDNTGHKIQTTRFRLGRALGDGFGRSAAGLELTAFDELGAPFWFELPTLTELASTPSSLERLRRLMAPPVDPESPPLNSLLNLAGTTITRSTNGLELRFSDPSQRSLAESELGAMLSWQPRPFGLRLGWLGEEETVLGSKADGAFGRLAAATLISGFELRLEAGNWHLSAAAELGWTVPEYGGGIITNLSGLTTSTFSLLATRRLSDNDQLTFSLSQPPRLEQGLATLSLPIGRTKGGRVLYQSTSTELTPSGRELDLAASWQREGLFGGTFRAEAALSDDPGHIESEPGFSLAAGWLVVF